MAPIANRLMPCFEQVVASQDWRPLRHLSFAAEHDGFDPFQLTELDGLNQIFWPGHCVQGLRGAGFASALDVAGIDYVVQKGIDVRIDSYSAFYEMVTVRRQA